MATLVEAIQGSHGRQGSNNSNNNANNHHEDEQLNGGDNRQASTTPTTSSNKRDEHKYELYRHEENRLRTYQNWPADAPISATRLARAGQVYTGQDLTTYCFSCQEKISDWTPDDNPVATHRPRFSTCKFNDPIHRDGNVAMERTRRLANFSRAASIRPPGGNTEQLSSHPEGSTGSRHQQQGAVSNGLASSSSSSAFGISTAQIYQLMKSEAERLRTFNNPSHPWPLHYVKPVDLANAGFFYTTIEDKVQCAFCRGQISTWLPGDDPMTEHKLHFMRRCPYLRGLDVGNIPICLDPCLGGRQAIGGAHYQLGSSPAASSASSSSGYSSGRSAPSPSSDSDEDMVAGSDEVGSQDRTLTAEGEANQNGGRGGVHAFPVPMDTTASLSEPSRQLMLASGLAIHSPPQQPNFMSPTARLQSFAAWPKSDIVAPADLVAAGFYYTHNRDCVQCYQCGGGLCDWNIGDSPMVEHWKYFPICSFVRMNYSPELDERPSAPPRPSSEAAEVVTAPATSSQQSNSSTASSNYFELPMSVSDPEESISSSTSSSSSSQAAVTANVAVTSAADLSLEMASGHFEDEATRKQRLDEERRRAREEITKRDEDRRRLEEDKKQKCSTSGDQGSGSETSSAAAASESSQSAESVKCLICLEKPRCVLYFPCRHLTTCEACGPTMATCPYCRERIQGLFKIFIP